MRAQTIASIASTFADWRGRQMACQSDIIDDNMTNVPNAQYAKVKDSGEKS